MKHYDKDEAVAKLLKLKAIKYEEDDKNLLSIHDHLILNEDGSVAEPQKVNLLLLNTIKALNERVELMEAALRKSMMIKFK